jgi:hypothetical protein
MQIPSVSEILPSDESVPAPSQILWALCLIRCNEASVFLATVTNSHANLLYRVVIISATDWRSSFLSFLSNKWHALPQGMPSKVEARQRHMVNDELEAVYLSFYM